MATDQEVAYHRSYLTINYLYFDPAIRWPEGRVDPAYDRYPLAERARAYKRRDPQLFEKNRLAMSTLLRVQYVEGFRPPDETVAKYMAWSGDLLQGQVRTPSGGIAVPNPGANHLAYRFVNGSLHKLWMWAKTDQDFEKFATAWEQKYSNLVYPYNRGFTPVVDESWQIIGHYGYVNRKNMPASTILPQDATTVSDDSIATALKKGVVIFVGDGFHPPSGWRRGLMGAQSDEYVLTGVDGEVLWHVTSTSTEGVESEDFSPLDILLAAKLLVDLGAALGSKLTRSLVLKAAANREARIVLRGPSEAMAKAVERRLAVQEATTLARLRGVTVAELKRVKSPRLLAKHPGRITPEALRAELRQKDFVLSKGGNHSVQGGQQDSEIWLRKIPNPRGSGEDYIEAIRIDIRYRDPNFQPRTPINKATGQPMTTSEVQASDKPFRQRHHTLNDPTVTESEQDAADLMNRGMRKEDLTHWHYERFPATQENLTEYLRVPAKGSGGPRINGLEKIDPTGKVVPNPEQGKSALPDPGGRR
jgi:hypothetical protein